ncbi:hypothetical protein [Yinghuangia sp. YIM S09857]|uniref:hypothetical protein n=1 Tax=Yinghuangia sp. YIM S09857 TaxID=3436929 RepID=UPI003F53AA4E
MGDALWDHWPGPWVGSTYDVRTVMGAMSRRTKDEFRYDVIPWRRFPHHGGPGEEIPVLLAALACAGAESADAAVSRLWSALRLEGRSADVAAWAVPFLIRIAAAGPPAASGTRARTLRLAAEIGRSLHSAADHGRSFSKSARTRW